MKKLALLLAAVLLMLTFISCGYRCHYCGDFEDLKVYGNHHYCPACLEEGNIDTEDLQIELERINGILNEL